MKIDLIFKIGWIMVVFVSIFALHSWFNCYQMNKQFEIKKENMTDCEIIQHKIDMARWRNIRLMYLEEQRNLILMGRCK